MVYFIKLIKEKNKRISLYHQKKDIDALESILAELNNEHSALTENINEVIYLLDLVDKHQIKTQKKVVSQIHGQHKEIKKWLQSLKGIFEGLYNTSTEALNTEDLDFMKLEVPKLIDKKEKLEHQIKYLNTIIVKTKVLLMDIQNELSKKITKGYDIGAVTQKMAAEFDKKVVGTYTSGRKKIIKFLERTFEINKLKSKELIDLLVKSNAINFKIDIPENDVFYYYKDYGFADENVPIIGAWNINY